MPSRSHSPNGSGRCSRSPSTLVEHGGKTSGFLGLLRTRHVIPGVRQAPACEFAFAGDRWFSWMQWASGGARGRAKRAESIPPTPSGVAQRGTIRRYLFAVPERHARNVPTVRRPRAADPGGGSVFQGFCRRASDSSPRTTAPCRTRSPDPSRRSTSTGRAPMPPIPPGASRTRARRAVEQQPARSLGGDGGATVRKNRCVQASCGKARTPIEQDRRPSSCGPRFWQAS